MASRDSKTRPSGAKSSAGGGAKPASKASAGSLVTAQLLSQLKNTAQKTSSSQTPAHAPAPAAPVEELLVHAPATAEPAPAPIPTPAPAPVPVPASVASVYTPPAPNSRAAAYQQAQPASSHGYSPQDDGRGAHPGGGHARVISITLTPYDLQLCERIRARFLDTTLAPSRSEILKLALHALDLDDDGLIEALLAVRERDGRRRKLEPGQTAPAAQYPAAPSGNGHGHAAAAPAYNSRPGR